MNYKNLILFAFILFFACEDNKEDKQLIDDGGITPDPWGVITTEKPRVFSASDVSQKTIDLTLEWYNIGAKAWGNYGPLEIWIVGSNKEAAIELDKLWCDTRLEMDLDWNVQRDCANGDPYVSGDGWSPFYNYVNDGGAAVSTYRRDYFNYHFLTMTMSSKYPGPEEDDYKPVTLHEYFHVYQHSHISDIEIKGDKGPRGTKNGGEGKPWFAEGSAEYMAQLLYSKQPGVNSGYLKETMSWKSSTVSDYKSFGKRLEDITYSDPVNAYDVGAWFIAYLVHQKGEEVFITNFYKNLDVLGFEGSFQKHYGKSSKEYVDDFNLFLDQGVTEALKIIP
ncbi:MAG: hypothetical protein HN653_05445 [Candidatus Marinimicrobia bacterium]|nr:hypothetical protein [Candidatus Neomarinimicrobiota bacterium]